ncbi:hypothetical protein MAR_006798 [Mya arenaria]|uniref:Uncharacterized protein n=1 Tax=Mya arenaria TaxID=6604 RepID=A0ABY7D9K4_MYAAR|nr:hypothetical protein MAR_006798 [Mya arenaria]
MSPCNWAASALTGGRRACLVMHTARHSLSQFRDSGLLVSMSFDIMFPSGLGSLTGAKYFSKLDRFRLRLMQFSFTIAHVPGKSLVIADYLSRHQLHNDQNDQNLQIDTDNYVQQIISNIPASNSTLDEISEKQQGDVVCKSLIYLLPK